MKVVFESRGELILRLLLAGVIVSYYVAEKWQ